MVSVAAADDTKTSDLTSNSVFGIEHRSTPSRAPVAGPGE